MASVNEIATWFGCDRASVNRRLKQFNLSGTIHPKDVLMLKPLNPQQEGALDLQTERAKLAREQARLAKLQADKLEGVFADVEELMHANNERDEAIAEIIKKSELSDARKEDILGLISEAMRKWGERFG